jgi:nucleoside-diphosphate-sugar epimerase
MRIVIFGATGSLGSHLIKELIKKKYNLVLYQHKKIIKKKKFLTIINQQILIKKKIAFNKSDVLIYLAWGNLNNYFSYNHLKQELPNHYKQIKNLIQLGIKNVICAGTCFEYGLQEGKLSESFLAKPIIPYAMAKEILRKKLLILKKNIYFKFTWLRIFYIYNNSMNNKKNLWSKIQTSLKKKKIFFHMSSGNQKRDYVDVVKFSKYVVKLIKLNKSFGIVNIASGKGTSIKKVVTNWKKKYKWNINFVFGSLNVPQYEPKNFWGCNNKLKKIIKNE